MRISIVAVACVTLLWSFLAHQTVDGITVKPREIMSVTTSKPKIKLLSKANKTIGGENQGVSDTRIRRLIPYMSYYTSPGNDYKYNPLEFLSLQQNVPLRKKPPQQIPSIAYLYGGPSKYPSNRPAVQAGFIYKARPEVYKNYVPLQPQMQPSYNSYKYQPSPNSFQPSVQINADITPFLNTNKLPGGFVPIFKSKNLPYKSYENVSPQQFAHHEHNLERMKPLDEDEFLPMNPSPVYYHKSPSNSNHLYLSKVISKSEQNTIKPITYSTPKPVYITSTETSQESFDHPEPLIPSYDYQEIVIDEPTTKSPEQQTIKVTTYAPDENHIQKIISAQKLNKLDLINDQLDLPDLESRSIEEVLAKLQKSNHLPATITPDNIDGSIKTLMKILADLKEKQIVPQIIQKPPTPIHNNHANDDYDYSSDEDDALRDGSPGPNTGRPGIDYPNYHDIPETSFSCKDQRYKGFFGDPDTKCQVWHYCDLNGGKASFLCPNGTIFSQVALTCDWWFNVRCSSTTQLYVLNERLYKFILPFKPKFPEDYSGPLVDKYLAIKYQEMEEKLKKEKEKAAAEAEGEKSKEEKDNQNEIESVSNESVEKPIEVEETYSSSSDDTVAYTPGPIRVPTEVPNDEPSSTVTDLISSSPLPPVPQIIVEQERLEMIEINNDGTSGHLTHNI